MVEIVKEPDWVGEESDQLFSWADFLLEDMEDRNVSESKYVPEIGIVSELSETPRRLEKAWKNESFDYVTYLGAGSVSNA